MITEYNDYGTSDYSYSRGQEISFFLFLFFFLKEKFDSLGAPVDGFQRILRGKVTSEKIEKPNQMWQDTYYRIWIDLQGEKKPKKVKKNKWN